MNTLFILFSLIFQILSNFLTIRRIMRLVSDRSEVRNFALEGQSKAYELTIWIQLESGLDFEWSSRRGFCFDSHGEDLNPSLIEQQIRCLTKDGKVSKVKASDPGSQRALDLIYLEGG